MASDVPDAPEATAVFYDGLIARRRAVAVILGEEGLVISSADGTLVELRYADLREQNAPTGRLRLSSTAARELARLEIADPSLAEEIRRRSPMLRKSVRSRLGGKIQVVGLPPLPEPKDEEQKPKQSAPPVSSSPSRA